jgi:DNA anti-recombination protein RmuC
MSNPTTNELFASNKQLNVKVNQLTKKVESDNQQILSSLKELNSNVNALIIQNRKIAEKIGETDKSKELQDFYKKNKQFIETSLNTIDNEFNNL